MPVEDPALGRARQTLEDWAFAYVTSCDLAYKIDPPAPPSELEEGAAPRFVEAPGRPPELRPSEKKARPMSEGKLRNPAKRAELFHTFFHHELQAAELMAWAILAFPDTPPAFRRGLARILGDEARHMRLYSEYLATLGFEVGAFPVRDWFWERVPRARTPAAFVATMGMGFEGGNLDHAARFAGRLAAAGDAAGAEIQRRIAEEEEPHAAFAVHWFRRFTGGLDFATWRAHLPEPLSPLVMRGRPLNPEARARAGFPPEFLEELAAW